MIHHELPLSLNLHMMNTRGNFSSSTVNHTLMTDSITYKKAPLIELIVELRWSVSVFTGTPVIAGTDVTFDAWFQALTVKLRELGFHELERLVPHNVMNFAQQPIFRYKKAGAPFPICQFGHGIFTINAGPPSYTKWEEFRPVVEQSIQALLQSKPEKAGINTLAGASLRYIDLFKGDLRAGQSNYDFMKDMLGVSVNIPEALLNYAAGKSGIEPTIALKIPLVEEDNANLIFQLAEGRIGQSMDTDTIMDLTYVTNQEIPAISAAILSRLDNARSMLHEWFRVLTAKLHDKMEPI